MDGFYICLPKSHLLALCQSNFYALGVIVIFDAYYLHLSDNLDLVLEASSLCRILSRPRMFSASETCCWISSPFLVLSELWLAGSTQLFWLKLLSKLTDSIWFLSASHLIALLGLRLTLPICYSLWLLILWLVQSSVVFMPRFCLPAPCSQK